MFSEQENPEESDISIQAQSDKVLPFSVVSKGVLAQLKVDCIPCQKETATDSTGVQHSPVGQIKLRWHKKDQAKSYSEVFFVVNSKTPMVVLGSTAFPDGNQLSSTTGNVHPVGLHQQTAGLHSPFICDHVISSRMLLTHQA